MTAPEAILREQAGRLLAIEVAIAHGIDAQSELISRDAALQKVLHELRERAVEQREGLEVRLAAAEIAPAPQPPPVSLLLSEAIASGRVDRVLAADYAAFAVAASEYALLIQLALRLFDQPLRELAPRGLQSYATAMRQLTDLLPGVVVADLDEHDVDCRCICPMCALGACGCTAAGESRIRGGWQQATPDSVPESGLVLSRPRTGSQLAASGVLAGDRLVAVDGQRISSFLDVQKAIRAHAIGDEVTLLIARGSAAPRELRVKHVSDY
jgi:PDZ domain-containing protein